MMTGNEEGGGAGHNISTEPAQIKGQRCPLPTQYWGQPGFVPDATVCMCVCVKVTQFNQKGDLTPDSRGISSSAQPMSSLCETTREASLWVQLSV